MKFMKKSILARLCLTIFLTLSTTAFVTEARTPARPCSQCGAGSVSQGTSRVYQHDERFSCQHGGTGKDIYGVYEITITERCDNCSYRNTRSYEDHIFKYCTSK